MLHWFDCMGVPPNVFKGEFEGDVLTLTTLFEGEYRRSD